MFGFQQWCINKFTKNLIKRKGQTIKFEREIEQFNRSLNPLVEIEYRFQNIDAYDWKSSQQ